VQRAEVATLWATSGKRDEGEAGADTWTVRSQRRRPRRGGSSGVAAAATGTKRVDGFFFFQASTMQAYGHGSRNGRPYRTGSPFKKRPQYLSLPLFFLNLHSIWLLEISSSVNLQPRR
jgi:hypothetical protein